MSRFQRTPDAAPKTAVPEQTALPANTPGLKPAVLHRNDKSGDEAQLKALQERMGKLQERRLRREIERDHAQQEIEACQKAAAALGISSLEDLEAHVTKLHEEDAQALSAFLAALDAEDALLSSIEQELAQLDDAS